MGSFQNDRDKVVINEVTVSFRAMKNSPHDSFTYDENGGFRGVNIDGHIYTGSENTAIKSVNVSFDGVSLELDVNGAMLMKDPEHRANLVARAKAEVARQEEEAKAIAAAASVFHELEHDKEKEAAFPDFAVWRCQVCRKYSSVRKDLPESQDYIAALDGGEKMGGCLGPPPSLGELGSPLAKVPPVPGEEGEGEDAEEDVADRKFQTAQTNPPGETRAPTEEEVAAFKRAQTPVTSWPRERKLTEAEESKAEDVATAASALAHATPPAQRKLTRRQRKGKK